MGYDTLPIEVQAARMSLAKRRPYLASALWSLCPVKADDLVTTMGVDQWWRLYYNSEAVRQWPVDEIAGVLYHELCHLIRDHAGRGRDLDDPGEWNVCGDAEINDNLIKEGFKLPGNPVTPAAIGQPEGLLAEEYYARRTQQRAQSSSGDNVQSDPKGDPSDDAGAPETGNSPNSPAQPETGSGAQEANSGTPGINPGQPESGSGAPGTNPKQPDANSGATEAGDQAHVTAPGAGKCGSCATGRQEPWEEGPPDEGSSPGISRGEAEMIRRDVARRIIEESQSMGSIPSYWKRWAEEKMRPKVDWRRELSAAVRHALSDVAGASDYTYRRPSRRQGNVGNGKVVFPSMRRPVPSVAVVVDTSGSISDKQLSQALAEVSGVLKSAGQREGIRVLAVDAAVQSCRRVFRPEQVELAGGGGTDMGKGLEAAERLRPKPQVVIVITDGYTPWPEEPPAKTRVIVGLVGGGTGPGWAKTIKIGGENNA